MYAISFVIPVRNDAARLERCLQSILADAGAIAPEIIVADNGSRDDSPAVAARYGARVLHIAGNVATVRNAGVAAARAPLVAFVDADHQIGAGWLRSALAALDSAKIAGVGAPYHAPADGTWVQQTYDRLRRHPDRIEPAEWFGAGNLIVRREVFEAVGGFDPALESCEDVDLCIRLRRAGWQLLNVPGMRSVHHGDPPTLTRLFWSELWRGRDNFRVSLRSPWSLRNAISLAIPIVELIAVPVGLAALFWWWPLGVLALGGATALVGARAAQIARRRNGENGGGLAAALAVAATYDAGRALALVARAAHHRRAPAARPSAT